MGTIPITLRYPTKTLLHNMYPRVMSQQTRTSANRFPKPQAPPRIFKMRSAGDSKSGSTDWRRSNTPPQVKTSSPPPATHSRFRRHSVRDRQQFNWNKSNSGRMLRPSAPTSSPDRVKRNRPEEATSLPGKHPEERSSSTEPAPEGALKRLLSGNGEFARRSSLECDRRSATAHALAASF